MNSIMDFKAKCIGYSSYQEFLNSGYWKAFTNKVRANRCYCCQDTKTLQVHHITYERFGKELETDVITVCSKCHCNIHKIARCGVPLESAHFSVKKKSLRSNTINDSKWVPYTRLFSLENNQGTDDVVRTLRFRGLMEKTSFWPTKKATDKGFARVKGTSDNLLFQWNKKKYNQMFGAVRNARVAKIKKNKDKQWVNWMKLCNISLKEKPRDVVSFLREKGYMDVGTFNPTKVAIDSKFAITELVDNKLRTKWDKDRYISMRKREREAMKSRGISSSTSQIS